MRPHAKADIREFSTEEETAGEKNQRGTVIPPLDIGPKVLGHSLIRPLVYTHRSLDSSGALLRSLAHLLARLPKAYGTVECFCATFKARHS